MILCFILLSLFVFSNATRCGNKVLYGTKTPYKLVEYRNTSVKHPHKCIPIQINMVYRHGNRYPTRQDVRKMDPLIEKINAEYKRAVSKSEYKPNLAVNVTYPLFQPFEEEWDTHLSKIGEKEMYDIGKRLKIRYPSIFSKSYSPMDYSFVSSCKLRCTHSSNALASGIFNSKNKVLGKCYSKTVAVNVLPCDRDYLMRFLDNCPKYLRKIISRYSTYDQDQKFGEGPEVKKVIEKVKNKLGLTNLKLKHYDIHMLFTLCSYEIGMFEGSLEKGFCKLFDIDDLRVLEYWYDMRNYYKRTNSIHTISHSSSCMLLKDVYDTLLNAKENYKNRYYHRAIFRSGHSKTIIPFFSFLGLFKDEKALRYDNFREMQNRNFHTGCSSPFSGNIYFVLYKCVDGKFKIQMNVNEKPMKIPCCDDEMSCDFNIFLACYKKSVESCNLTKRCKIKKEK